MAEVGPVDVAVSDRAGYARVSIRRDGAVKLILPKRMSLEQGRQFLDSAREWIKKHRRRCHVESLDPRLDRFSAGKLLIARLEELVLYYSSIDG